MTELRKDYILDRYVLISESRSKRPKEFRRQEIKEEVTQCFFCPGNENLTPPEIGRITVDGGKGWKMRWFPNKFAAVELEGQQVIKTDNTYFTFSGGYGKHEVIAETPDHNKQLWDLSETDIITLFKVYSQRIVELEKIPNIRYVNVFKNHGREGGTSIVHSHTQVVATNFVPTLIMDELTAARKFPSCPYCEILNIEKGSDRRCFENNAFAAFTPYASRFNFEIWAFPKRHVRKLEDLDENELKDLAEIMKKILAKLKELNVSYNYFIHYAPDSTDLHLHIEICPRIATWAGFEYCTNAAINSVSPEMAAKFYRGEE